MSAGQGLRCSDQAQEGEGQRAAGAELKTANQRIAARKRRARKRSRSWWTLAPPRPSSTRAEEATAANRNLTEKVKELKAELKGAQQAATRAQRRRRGLSANGADPNPILQQKAKSFTSWNEK